MNVLHLTFEKPFATQHKRNGYNARGELATAWQQSDKADTAPLAGEPLAGTGVGYAYDAIGNRLSHTEAGAADIIGVSGPNGAGTTAVTLKDQRVHNYSPNAANQYTQVTHPGFFNVRGSCATGAAIVVNGASINASGYQPGSSGTIFRAEVPNLTPPPAGTTNPDIYEPVKVTQSGVVLTVDDPIQYVPPPVESLTYDADGNLKTDGRWTCTWDAADRLVRMESTAFTQPASTTPPLLAVTVPARVIEFAYDGLSRRIRKKVTEGGSSIVLWEAYVYDGWNMVLSVKLNPAAGASQGRPQSAIASYVWGPDLGSKPFARRNWQAAGGVRGLILANYFTGANGGGLHAPGMDAMGNVTSVTRLGLSSYSGGPYFRSEFVYDYDAFGKEMRSSTLVAGLNPDSFPFHYSTKFTDPESGFNYYGYRFYDPANGRWINRDPIGEKGGVNLYGMVGNDTVNFTDYLGWTLEPAEELAEPQNVVIRKMLAKLKECGGKRTKAIIKQLEESRNKHTIRPGPPGAGGGATATDPKLENQKGVGTGTDTKVPLGGQEGFTREETLIHELSHASDFDSGIMEPRDAHGNRPDNNNNGFPDTEDRAVEAQNDYSDAAKTGHNRSDYGDLDPADSRKK